MRRTNPGFQRDLNSVPSEHEARLFASWANKHKCHCKVQMSNLDTAITVQQSWIWEPWTSKAGFESSPGPWLTICQARLLSNISKLHFLPSNSESQTLLRCCVQILQTIHLSEWKKFFHHVGDSNLGLLDLSHRLDRFASTSDLSATHKREFWLFLW